MTDSRGAEHTVQPDGSDGSLVDSAMMSLEDLPALQAWFEQLRQDEQPFSQCAAALLSFELAIRGDPIAKSNLALTIEQLLRFRNDDHVMAQVKGRAALFNIWDRAESLILSFRRKRLSEKLNACWQSKSDQTLLQQAIDDLQPAGERRVEFAKCLYHLELARMGVKASRVEFARRAELIRDAYLHAEIANALVYDDRGLKFLWKELIPYLDEFFESLEEAQEAAHKTAPNLAPIESETVETETPRDEPDEILEAELIAESEQVETLIDAVAIEPITEEPPLPPPAAIHTPADAMYTEVDSVEEDLPEIPAQWMEEIEGPDFAPDPETLKFWRFAEEQIAILPKEQGPKTGQGLLAQSRTDRKQFREFFQKIEERFPKNPDARAFSCLLQLCLASQLKEKTLFGQVNAKRQEAFASALGMLSNNAAAASHAAVWFQLDGSNTEKALQLGLETIWDYLQFCSLARIDPLDSESPGRFTRNEL